jgi:hypothetical protein
VDGRAVTSAEEFFAALGAAVTEQGPRLIEVVM